MYTEVCWFLKSNIFFSPLLICMFASALSLFTTTSTIFPLANNQENIWAIKQERHQHSIQHYSNIYQLPPDMHLEQIKTDRNTSYSILLIEPNYMICFVFCKELTTMYMYFFLLHRTHEWCFKMLTSLILVYYMYNITTYPSMVGSSSSTISLYFAIPVHGSSLESSVLAFLWG